MASIAPYYFGIQEEARPLEPTAAAKLPKSVLLIEDSEEEMLLVKFALEEHGRGLYELRWAPNLSEGIDYLSIWVYRKALDRPATRGFAKLRRKHRLSF